MWAVVPAAGKGLRLGAALPKQYLTLQNKTVIEHTLERLLEIERIEGIVVAVSPEDEYWHELAIASHQRIVTVAGGAERCDSVLAGIDGVISNAGEVDWVLVHDAVRPCFAVEDVLTLIDRVVAHPVGGLLGVPVVDTLKRVDQHAVVLETLDRTTIWQAQTPQMFRCVPLRNALLEAIHSNTQITDEASAMEQAGHRPLMVAGRGDNLKITRHEDLTLAEFYLRRLAQGVADSQADEDAQL